MRVSNASCAMRPFMRDAPRAPRVLPSTARPIRSSSFASIVHARSDVRVHAPLALSSLTAPRAGLASQARVSAQSGAQFKELSRRTPLHVNE